MDILSKDQLLFLQDNLSFENYEKFMNMYNDKDEILPKDIKERNEYILNKMKLHYYWGDIKGWGGGRVYKNISNESRFNEYIYSLFKGNTKKELLEFLDNYRYKGEINDLLYVSDSDDNYDE